MNTEATSSRRDVLRGTLAWACALMLPGTLIGCDSRQETQSTAPVPTPPVNDGLTPSYESGKVSQISVQYQATANDGRKCSDCLHFMSETSTCKMVEGQISPEGWCTIWTMKT